VNDLQVRGILKGLLSVLQLSDIIGLLRNV